MATQTTVFPRATQGGQFAALRYGQFGAPRLVNFKRYSMVSLSVFSSHGKKVFSVIKNVLRQYGLSDLVNRVKCIPVNFYQNVQFASDFLTTYLKDPVFDRDESSYIIKGVPELLTRLKSDTDIAIQNPKCVPEVYLDALLKYYYSKRPDIISTSIWARTVNSPAPLFLTDSKTNMITAASDDPNSVIERQLVQIDDDGGMQSYIQPLRSYYDGKDKGCLIVGCETSPGEFYGMSSQDGLGVTAVGKGCNWPSDEDGLLPSDLGTSFSTPEIAAKLFIAKGFWRSKGFVGKKEISPLDATKLVILSSDIEEPLIGHFASAGRISLKKLLRPTGSYLVDISGKIISIDSIAVGNIKYTDSITGRIQTPTLNYRSSFWGIYCKNNKIFMYDEGVRQRWFAVAPDNFSVTYYIDNKPDTIISLEDFKTHFSQLVIAKN